MVIESLSCNTAALLVLLWEAVLEFTKEPSVMDNTAWLKWNDRSSGACVVEWKELGQGPSTRKMLEKYSYS